MKGEGSHESTIGETRPGCSKPRPGPGAKGSASRPLQYHASTSVHTRGSFVRLTISVRTRMPGSQGRIS